MTSRYWQSQLLAMLLLGLACAPGVPEENDGPVEETGEGETHLDIHVEPESIQAWGIEVGPVGTTSISAEVTLPGVLTANENRTAHIAALVPGQIAEVRADLGSRVRTGEVLAFLNAPEFTTAQTEFMRAFARAELSRNDFERAQALRERQAIEEREFLRRQSLFEQNLAEMRATEVILHSLGVSDEGIQAIAEGVNISVPARDHRAVEPLLPVRTPLGGVVLDRDAVLGDHTEPGRTLFTVSDLSVLWARLDAYENQLAFLDPAAEVVVRTPLLPDRDFPGRVTFIADKVDEELRTVQVRVEVPNPDGALKPNMYVQGFLRVSGEGHARIVVPEEAIQLLEGESVVFVQESPEPGEDHLVFEVRRVVPGEILTVGRVVEEGLDGSELVVMKGAFTLKAELTKGTGGHDHAH
ncbi:efflux RND transporter periplasmic adaptor subunit [Gemmatimonadota bacterium]